ncbi:MAG: hypothetical protein OHK0013_09160 [Sandaracinaceae bacterium]
MRRATALLAILVTTSASAGCLRRRYDLCAEVPPHPECPLDGAVAGDAAPDAGPIADAPTSDAPTSDAAPDAAALDAP